MMVQKALSDRDVVHMVEALQAGGWWIFLIVAVLAYTAYETIKLVLRHRERMAMIQAGMHPDAKADGKLPSPKGGAGKGQLEPPLRA